MAANIFWLGTKELRAFSHDFVLVALVVWAFSFSIVSIARSSLQELHDASIGIADEDHMMTGLFHGLDGPFDQGLGAKIPGHGVQSDAHGWLPPGRRINS